jgi:hypothetical protein
MKRKVTLTITKIRRRTATAPAHLSGVHCPLCGREVELLDGAEAAATLETTEAILARLNSSVEVHAFETLSGRLKFCKDSLSD